MAKKKTHGGPREGSGRPKKTDKKKTTSITATEGEIQAWTEAAESAGVSRAVWISLACNAMLRVDLKELVWQAKQAGKSVEEYVSEKLLSD